MQEMRFFDADNAQQTDDPNSGDEVFADPIIGEYALKSSGEDLGVEDLFERRVGDDSIMTVLCTVKDFSICCSNLFMVLERCENWE